ncbi:4-(cytidine 5'-diphospho)-2-C-methyl-D-erythritol kinase [Listeria booriae]|uniref:4-diphosphocytidyl-2-C-methyl-D-erythritol kinase n=1 Tax=Listeria booriae TaxID=1552123 RepID=A0A7X0XF58_9LIST|nr:4-(cytidine 5'-diphospho)-2-C-methyl-D-erythritol kinase [Listeria booriae]MBC1291539.1 4-(cytidine 5'-diphospho)-2-C-methyl-D-erythritol kinase [Listeria booriae]MBC1493110.1 4-(cytidine 5'-diphospho)-2-C-methyl-D-erythritol kinase [Listeria booriae]MBC1503372.1 4-(cytidine 5'-diphospho)-2-C-methyl-D-erythritol kinase [Listeria booriae]MBC1530194.1 4-(cytidine 5'-diphospho)-2-C-methyl-D-erythritol kinase [Listeria booriae]MBC1945269.1 4-(cytidine 5'-diphospho)-2-C-methyl-D-erythritol kinas
MKINVKAPAKINLSLDALYKRKDNYHELEMVMTTIDLADRLQLVLLEKDCIKLDVKAHFIPDDKRNLVYQAAALLKERFQIKQGVAITLDKSIPVAAGLAGGSSDAAAALKGLNQLWDLNLSLEELADLGAELGSDIPFCLYGGTALATGRGEVIEPLPMMPNCWIVLAKPSISVSTPGVYRDLKVGEVKHPNTKGMVQAIQDGSFEGICDNIGNVLETVTLVKHPEVKRIKEKMLEFGADTALMSGSGPTVFALVKQYSRAKRVYNGLRGFCEEVYLVRPWQEER